MSLNVLSTKTDDIIQNSYVNDKVLNEKNIEDSKEEYNFEETKDHFDDGRVPPKLEFFFSGDNENFVNACNLIGLDQENNEFVSFCLDMGQNMMTDSNLLIHIERGNIFNDNFNTNENFYNFLLVQQDKTKKFILKHI